MIQQIVQQKNLTLTKPIRKIAFIDKSDPDNAMNNYSNQRIPIALIGDVSIKELICELEDYDFLFDTQGLKVGDKTNIYEISIYLAPNDEILKLYQNDQCFKNTITKEVLLYTSESSFNIETPEKTLTIQTNKNNYYYGHIYEYKKKNEKTGKYGNLGYTFTFYINPNIYNFGETICMVKDVLGIE